MAKHISLLMRPWKSTQMRRASMILRYGWIAAATASWACRHLASITKPSHLLSSRFQAVCCLCKSWRGKIPAQLELEAPTLVSRSGDCQHTAKTTTHPHTVKSWPLHATRVCACFFTMSTGIKTWLKELKNCCTTDRRASII